MFKQQIAILAARREPFYDPHSFKPRKEKRKPVFSRGNVFYGNFQKAKGAASSVAEKPSQLEEIVAKSQEETRDQPKQYLFDVPNRYGYSTIQIEVRRRDGSYGVLLHEKGCCSPKGKVDEKEVLDIIRRYVSRHGTKVSLNLDVSETDMAKIFSAYTGNLDPNSNPFIHIVYGNREEVTLFMGFPSIGVLQYSRHSISQTKEIIESMLDDFPEMQIKIISPLPQEAYDFLRSR